MCEDCQYIGEIWDTIIKECPIPRKSHRDFVDYLDEVKIKQVISIPIDAIMRIIDGLEVIEHFKKKIWIEKVMNDLIHLILNLIRFL